MADILFITPNTGESVIDESLGTLLLATILRRSGLDAAIMPFSRFGDPNDLDNFLSHAVTAILQSGAEIVSFYTRCDCYHIMLRLAEKLKQQRNVYIVFAGPQADISALDTIRQIPYVDYICRGEGELTVVPFFSSLLRGQPDHTIDGLVYRREGRVMENPRPPLIEDLDSLPHLDYSIVGLEPVSELSDPFPIDVGRGCPFGCTYCSTKTFWGRRYRLKSPQRIVEEVKRLHDQYHITYFTFTHDMFTMNRSQVTETCRLLKTLDFPVTWSCSARLDCLDEELIDFMTESGLRRIYIGLETGSQRMQKLINKNLKLDRAMKLLRYLESKKLRILTSFIYGFPEETEEDVSQTIALIAQIMRLKNTSIPLHLCTFLPGTELAQQYLSRLTPTAHYSNITGATAVDQCTDLIRRHPGIFTYFGEYHTPLREKLKYFPAFIGVWTRLQPVYRYFSEQYGPERLFDMYADFVQANRETLERHTALDVYDQVVQILADDRFAAQCSHGPYEDLIADYYRFAVLKDTAVQAKGRPVSDVFSFSPDDIDPDMRLQDSPRCLAVVTCFLDRDQKLRLKIRKRK